jgi:hypothetical protein
LATALGTLAALGLGGRLGLDCFDGQERNGVVHPVIPRVHGVVHPLHGPGTSLLTPSGLEEALAFTVNITVGLVALLFYSSFAPRWTSMLVSFLCSSNKGSRMYFLAFP